MKVIIKGRGLEVESALADHKPYNTKQIFEQVLIKELNVSTKVTKNGLDCYRFESGHAGERCFGTSDNAMVSGFHFDVSPDANSSIYGQSKELVYGGLAIEWFTNQKNKNQAKEIGSAIWRLLESWNISPIATQSSIAR